MSVQHIITEKIQQQFQPHFFAIENESHRHSSGRGAESHFKCVVVSEMFDNIRKVQRHQRVYQLLQDELNNGVHALALHLYTPAEWAALNEQMPISTNCLGVGH